MSIRSLTYRTFSWLEAPKISTDLLWELVLIFAGLAGVYLLLIFRVRNRISARREAVRLQKRELAPMISNFLFYQHESEDEDRETYIRMKIEIRELLKVPLNRVVMTEVLMDLRMDVSGEARDRLFQLFQDLELDRDSFRKLESWRWERVSQAIMELTDMQVEKAYPFIRKFINDRRGVIRKQAQLATVMLREEGISYFLDTARYRISEWQQLKLLEILRQREDFNPPRFRAWLTSENRDVVLFALRLIRYYRQNDAERALVTLLRHRSQVVRAAALECIREFRFHSALEPIKALFPKSNEELKLLILDTLGLIATEAELGFLEEIASRDGNFVVRSKARAVMNQLKPDSALPLVDPGTTPDTWEDSAPDPETPAVGNSPEVTATLVETHASAQEDSEICQDPVSPILDEEAFTISEEMPSFVEEVPISLDRDETEPGWEEDEAIFEACFLEELDDILSELSPPEEPVEFLPLDFLPLVTGAESHPDDFLELEVVAEDVAPPEIDCRSVGAGEPQKGTCLDRLNTDFLPWVVVGPDLPDTPQPEPLKEPIMSEAANCPPGHSAFFWEPLFELDGVSQPAAPAAPEGPFDASAGQGEEGARQFSIFREFFREYDTESKLILLEHIAEVGEEKEWEFLCELQQDPEPAIRNKATQMLRRLGSRLGLELPAGTGSAQKDILPAQATDFPELELNFTPESARRPYPEADQGKRVPHQPAGRLLRWAVRRKKQNHG